MKDSTAYHFHALLSRLRCSPVLTAMLVTSLIFGVTASIAGIAVWRGTSACLAETSAPPNVTMHQALQAELVMEVGQTTPSGSALSHKVASAACPCAASNRWHWQRI
jgi:hypothetical protein